MKSKTALQTTNRQGSLFTDGDTTKKILYRYCVENLTQSQIAARFGISHGGIQKFIRRQRNRINSCLEQGQSLDAIALELGIPTETIYKLIDENVWKKYSGTQQNCTRQPWTSPPSSTQI